MHINRLVLKDVKGFEALDFSFSHKGWNTLTGENGSGKTALLKAIAMALVGPDVARILQPSQRGWIREGSAKSEIAVQIAPDTRDKFSTGRRVAEFFWSELEISLNGGPEASIKPGNRRRRDKRGPLNGPWAENTAGWFAAGYGPFRRLFGASPEAQRLMSGPSRVARFATMFKEDATLGECELWLKDLSHKSLENREREKRVLEQVEGLLNDDFLRSGLQIDRVDSDGVWLRDRSGTVLPLAEMSEGYRSALALMIDILKHFESAYGEEGLVTEEDGHKVVHHKGVVLIDEVDAHLHPAWQREIGFWLKKRFPETQFIVTTHSALVCQAADKIFHLPPPGSGESPMQLSDEDYRKVVRSTPNEILLSPAFGLTQTRSPIVVEARQRYARLNSKQLTLALQPEEKKELKDLELYLDPVEAMNENA